MKARVFLDALHLETRIGATEEERARYQTLIADISLRPNRSFPSTGDDLNLAVDYARVSVIAREIAQEKVRNLLENLACDLCSGLLSAFPVKRVSVTLRKKLLPECDYSGVSLTLRK